MEKRDFAGAIRDRVIKAKSGTLFVMVDFADLAPNNVANRVVLRLVNEGALKVVTRGVYQKPHYSKFLGEDIVPSVDAVAQALARKSGWAIRPDGDTALNLLGLSTQVPANWCYLSDGPYKSYSCLGGTIRFKHSANRLLGNLSWNAALVVQALRALGRERVDAKVVSQLVARFEAGVWYEIMVELKGAPDWVREVVRAVKEAKDA